MIGGVISAVIVWLSSRRKTTADIHKAAAETAATWEGIAGRCATRLNALEEAFAQERHKWETERQQAHTRQALLEAEMDVLRAKVFALGKRLTELMPP